MRLDLNECFPQAGDGTRGPLPKQRAFLNYALSKGSPKYILYCGGIGSGKTLIGCITVLSWAVLYPGDYLVCRQFAPELKITTLKTFLEICPKELIQEYRVADGIVKIKAVGGKVSNIIFRQLEEPDKLRSLNLSGFYIDESSQVSEVAFQLLQGRLRGPGIKKGILTTNPNGHDWQYQWFVKQDMMKSDDAKRNFVLIKAPSTENHHLPDGYVQSMMDTWSDDRIRREIYGDFDSFSGQVYSEFRRDLHVIKPFVIPDEWTRIIGVDHGLRNPACWLWGAVDYDENIYIYREFYEKEWLIEEIVRGKRGKGEPERPGVAALMKGERIEGAYIDPTTTQRRGQTGFSDYDHYLEQLPAGFPLKLGNNDVKAGIERVKQFLKVSPVTHKPQVFIFDTCVNLIEELSQYRYKELLPNQAGKKSEDEQPMKVNDHACLTADNLVLTESGYKPITDVSTADRVLTRKGFKAVEWSGNTGYKPTVALMLSDGRVLRMTAEHPVLTDGEFRRADETVGKRVWLDEYSLKENGLPSTTVTTGPTQLTSEMAWKPSTERFTSPTTGLYRLDTTFTTETGTSTTTTYQTWNVCQPPLTSACTLEAASGFSQEQQQSTLARYVGKLLRGTVPMQAGSGIGSTRAALPAWFSMSLPKSSVPANTAVTASAPFRQSLFQSIALITANQPLAAKAALTLKLVLAKAAHAYSRLIGTPNRVTVLASVPGPAESVFNLTVKDEPEFFANGVLVHNCDAFRYLCMSRPEPPKRERNPLAGIDPYSSQGRMIRHIQDLKRPRSGDLFGD